MVEISRLLRITRRRLAFMILVALGVAIPLSGVLLLRPIQYKATANVNLNSLYNHSASDIEQRRVAADFGAALKVSSVEQKAASAAKHTTPGQVDRTLVYSPPTSGYIAKVSYDAGSADQARNVVLAASRAALALLASQDVQDSQSSVNKASVGAQATGQAVTTYLQGRPGLSGQAAAVASLRGQVSPHPTTTDLTKTLGTLELNGGNVAPSDPVYAQKLTAFTAAFKQYDAAVKRHMNALNNEANISSPSNVVVGTPSAIGPLQTAAIDGFAGGAAAALLVAIAFVAKEFRWFRKGASLDAAPVASISEETESPKRDRVGPFGRWLAGTPPDRLQTVSLVLALALAVAIGVSAPLLFSSQKKTVALVIAIPLGIVAGLIALYRFEIFLLGLLVLRTSLDAVNVSSSSGSGIDPGAAVGLVFLIAAAFWLLAQRRWGHWRKTSAPVWWLWTFTAVTGISAAGAAMPLTTLEATTKVAAGVVMFQVLEQYIHQRPERVKKLFGALLISSIPPCIVAAYQFVVGHGDSVGVSVARVTGTYVHPSSLANFLLFTLPVSIMLIGWCRGRARVAAVAITSVYGVMLILTYTRAAWVAAVVFLVYLGVRYKPAILWALLVAVAVLVIAVPTVSNRFSDLGGSSAQSATVANGGDSNSLSWRMNYWKSLLPEAKHDLVNGIGFEMVQATNPQHLDPHNGFVQSYVELGIVGVITLIGLLVSFVTYLRRRVHFARTPWEKMLAMIAIGAAIGWIAQMPMENLFDQTFVYWYFAVALTFGYPMSETSDEAAADSPPLLVAETPKPDVVGV